MHLLAPSSTAGRVYLAVNASVANYDIYAATIALLGIPALNRRVDVIVTIASQIIVHGTYATSWAMTTGIGWLANCTLTLINNGYIEGRGGDGNGGDGGDALVLHWPLALDNSGGYVYGGGGGGAQGLTYPGGVMPLWGGGGGGGGQGNPGGQGGQYAFPCDTAGEWGDDGSTTAPGAGGAPGAQYGSVGGGYGGRGGAWGMSGSNSGPDYANRINTDRGSAGYAVRRNGNTLTQLGGFDATRIKGLYS